MTRHEMIELLGWHYQTMTDEQRDTLSRVERIVEVAVLREREACAKLCDRLSIDRGFFHPDDEDFKRGFLDGIKVCAISIRSVLTNKKT